MSTKADSDELVFIVDETHEDQKCSREKFKCTREAVWVIEWSGHCPGPRAYCIPCFQLFEEFEGRGTCPHGERCIALNVHPVSRN